MDDLVELRDTLDRTKKAAAAAEARFAEGCLPIEFVQYCVMHRDGEALASADLHALIIPMDWGRPH